MAIKFVGKAGSSTAANGTALQSIAAEPLKNTAKSAKPGKGHARALDVSGLNLNSAQRLLTGHVLTLLNTSDSTLKRRIEAGDFPPPDGKFGKRPFWLASTVRPYFLGTEGGAA